MCQAEFLYWRLNAKRGAPPAGIQASQLIDRGFGHLILQVWTINIYICIYMYMFVCMFVCMCVYIYILYTHIHIMTYTIQMCRVKNPHGQISPLVKSRQFSPSASHTSRRPRDSGHCAELEPQWLKHADGLETAEKVGEIM